MKNRAGALLISIFLMFCGYPSGSHPRGQDALYPEQQEIDAMLGGPAPAGVLFTVMEQDEEALRWVLPRLLHYTQQLRGAWHDLPIAVLSHGDEMFALLREFKPLYPQLHRDLQQLENQYGVTFHVCGTFAAMSDVAPSEFPDYVDVVPFGPAQIENYRQMDFKIVSVEPTW